MVMGRRSLAEDERMSSWTPRFGGRRHRRHVDFRWQEG